MGDIYSPEQGGVMKLKPSDQVVDKAGPCHIVISKGEEGYEIGHFDNKQEEISFIKEQFSQGKAVGALPTYSEFNGTAEELFNKSTPVKTIPKRRG